MSTIARRLMIVTLLVFLLAGLGMSGFWVFGADRLRANLDLWAANWRAAGNGVTYKPFSVSGFPLFFRTQLDDFAIAGGGTASPWRWQAPTILLRASPFAPTRARADFAGEHKVLASLFGAALSFTATTEEGTGRVQRRGDTYRGGLDLHDATLAVEGVDGRFTLKEAILDAFHARNVADHETAGAGLTVNVDDLTLPAGFVPGPLGARIDSLALDAEVMGGIGPVLDRSAVTAWRDAGGTVEVNDFTLRWGPLHIKAKGTMALDGNLQPLAAFTATLTGFGESLDAMVEEGTLDAQDATSAKMLLSLLARTPLTGGPPAISVPLTIQNQRLSVGPVPLFTLRPIVWPAT
ncbi:MAG TPA: DUF2125 domain-containing protein [Alphaproteobacteria bacterium]|jgi:hypothetical protein